MKRVIRKLALYNSAKYIYYSFGQYRRHLRNLFKPTARILIYHRIADPQNDPYLLCVSPQNFHAQIKFLKENFRVVPLVQLVQEVRSKKLKNETVAITFDDGYVDNLHNALPILEEYGVPATIFITAGYVGGSKPFYWDAPEGVDLNERVPMAKPSRILDRVGTTSELGRPMTIDEAKTLSWAHLIEIGGHTISRPKLDKIPENDQFREIAGGKRIIEKMLDIPLLSFAYPFGGKDSFDKTTIELIKKAGFQYACSNIHKRVTNRSNVYALPRFIARNWNIEEFKKEMTKWV